MNDKELKYMALIMVVYGVRNTVLEDYHALRRLVQGQGFPNGEVGKMLRVVCEIKANEFG